MSSKSTKEDTPNKPVYAKMVNVGAVPQWLVLILCFISISSSQNFNYEDCPPGEDCQNLEDPQLALRRRPPFPPPSRPPPSRPPPFILPPLPMNLDVEDLEFGHDTEQMEELWERENLGGQNEADEDLVETYNSEENKVASLNKKEE